MMNEGVKILIERMKTNPEEFTDSSKWAGVIHGYKSYLSKEDEQALDDAYNGLMQAKFTEKVMTELLAPEEDDSLGKPWYTTQGGQKGSVLGGQTPVRSSVTLNNINAVGTWGTSAASSVADAQTYQMEQMKAHLEVHRAAMKAEEQKRHETLYGKLKNYLHADK